MSSLINRVSMSSKMKVLIADTEEGKFPSTSYHRLPDYSSFPASATASQRNEKGEIHDAADRVPLHQYAAGETSWNASHYGQQHQRQQQEQEQEQEQEAQKQQQQHTNNNNNNNQRHHHSRSSNQGVLLSDHSDHSSSASAFAFSPSPSSPFMSLSPPTSTPPRPSDSLGNQVVSNSPP